MTSFYEELRKKDSVSDEKENEKSRKNIDKWVFRLFLCLLSLMPLLIFANIQEVISPLISNIDLLSSGMKGELFTHYKTIITVVITVIVGMMLLAKILFMGGTVRKTYLNYVLGIFVVVIIVSTVLSPNATIALTGQYNRSDGAISWLCYVILLFTALNIEYPKNVVRYIMYAMMPLVYLNLVIITMNFYGKDLLQITFVQKFISITLPEGASLATNSELVGTLNQWNYMSGMFAIMFTMYLAWSLTADKVIENILGLITSVAAIAIVLMSVSTSGFLTSIVSFLILLIALFKIGNWKKTLIILGSLIILVIPVFHILAEKDSKVWEESIGFLVSKNPYLKDTVSFSLSDNKVYASDEVFELPSLPAKGNSAGSGRIYIWDKTFDLIKERVFIGYGADSLMYNFPHYNIDARAGIKSEHTITDKAHNQYIGALYGFGLFGLLAFAILAISSFLLTFKSIVNRSWGLFVLSITSMAYFIQAIFNDSLPGITPIAFILLGVAMYIFNVESKEQLINE